MQELSTIITDLDRRFGITEKRMDSCEGHGDFVAAKVERSGNWSGCPHCSRDAQSRAEQEEQQRERERRASARVMALLGRAAIPPRFEDKAFADYRVESDGQRRALDVCRNYAETFPERVEDGRCLLLLGNPGTGKTHLVTAIAGEVIRRHRMSAIYSTVTDAVRQFKDNWTTRARAESEIIEAFASPSLLVLDEIGMGWGSETELNLLFEIINARYQAKRPTVFAGNIARDEVRQCLGDRVADRLNESGGTTIVCKWASARV